MNSHEFSSPSKPIKGSPTIRFSNCPELVKGVTSGCRKGLDKKDIFNHMTVIKKEVRRKKMTRCNKREQGFPANPCCLLGYKNRRQSRRKGTTLSRGDITRECVMVITR